MELASDQRVYYVHCNFCNTILAVSVPGCSNMLNMVTVRCGHCGNLLSVTMGASAPNSLPPPNPTTTQKQQQFTCGFGDYYHHWNKEANGNNMYCGSSSAAPSKCSFRSHEYQLLQQDDHELPKMPTPRR